MKKKKSQLHGIFAECIRNDGYKVSLKLNKIYQVIPDNSYKDLPMIRVIDESGEDYLYPEEFFRFVKF